MAQGTRLTPMGEAQRTFDLLASIETDDCVLWPLSLVNGYGQLRRDGERLAHIVVCVKTYGPRPPGMHACHGCGVRACMNYRHLRWDTPKGNEADKLIHNRHNRGSRQGLSKLTEDDVREIRRLEGAVPKRVIAARFGITTAYVIQIFNRRSWAWLEPEVSRPEHRFVNRGEGDGMAKLTASKVEEIRCLLSVGGLTHKQIGERFGVTGGTVTSIKNRKNWAWLP